MAMKTTVVTYDTEQFDGNNYIEQIIQDALDEVGVIYDLETYRSRTYKDVVITFGESLGGNLEIVHASGSYTLTLSDSVGLTENLKRSAEDLAKRGILYLDRSRLLRQIESLI